MKQVLLTGASGSMGKVAFREILKKQDMYKPVLLVLPSNKNKKLFSQYIGKEKSKAVKGGVTVGKGVTIVWGDITDINDVKRAVRGCDMVINMAAIIPPRAHKSFSATMAVNHGGVKNIIEAIKSEPDGIDKIKFITISSVAVYGDRLPPYHMLKVGDPVMPAIGDFYALSKIRAERELVESGLKNWAVVRQTFITIANLFRLMDPIMYHQPIDQHLEAITDNDAGREIINLIDAPDEFWCKIYNMSGGEKMRFIYHEYLAKMFGIFGLNTPKCIDRNWFALRNFHCGWYLDYERLTKYSGEAEESYEDHYNQVVAATPKILGIAKIAPSAIVRIFMKMYADPLRWVKNPTKYDLHIKAFFGDKKNWEKIPTWKSDMPGPMEAKIIDMGIEFKEDDSYSITDLKQAAEFRGGRCLSSAFEGMNVKHSWKCSCGEEFEATPRLIIDGGHWCPSCTPPDWKYCETAKANKHLAQPYYNMNSVNENTIYKLEAFMKESGIKD
ncbi:MAG: NAD-dependent epimerase/dehydratase family protein [Spirochaetales bacterium]|nr:NAD-dependent epimerase/dehydratase family protein [Spirochaetales bacterium]